MDVIAYFKDTTPTVEALVRNQLLRGFSKATQDFYIHLHLSHCRGHGWYKNGFIPVSYEYLKSHFRNTVDKKEIVSLSELELITVTGYDKQAGKSREFKIPYRYRLALLQAFLKDIRTGTQITRKIIERVAEGRLDSSFYDKNRNLKSRLAKKSVGLIQAKVNLQAIKTSIDKRASFLSSDNKNAEYSTISRDKLLSSAEYDHGVTLRPPFGEEITDDFIKYCPDYILTRTGRVSERGGFQNMSKFGKQAALSEIPHARNYDLRSSQISGLLQEAGKIGIDTTILEGYLADNEAKFKWAEKVGFKDMKGDPHSGLWKHCLMSLVFSGSVAKYYGSIYKAIDSEYYGQHELIDKLHNSFVKHVVPFRAVIRDWNMKLPQYLKLYSRNSKHGRIFKNACGMKLNLNSEDAKDKKFVSAFILQGLEASMIHNLVLLGDQYGFRTLSHEHDGLVVCGKIPDEAIRIAKRQSGFELAELDRKAII
jgi:hypothetical protein